MSDQSAAPGSLAAQVESWAPEPTHATDGISPAPSETFASLLNALTGREVGLPEVVPPLWHWLYFLEWPDSDELADDGHPRSAGFQPPIADRRRMFAGGRLTVERPLRYGCLTERTSWLKRVEPKSGRSGDLLFTTVSSEVMQDGQRVLVEEQDFVYRSGPAAKTDAARQEAAPTQPTEAEMTFALDPVSLFRFSALTANSHRIHYDLDYARDVEGYPDLLVHGPLLALLMAEQVRAHDVRSIQYRLIAPLYAHQAGMILARPTAAGVDVEVVGQDGRPRAVAAVETELAQR